MAEAEYFPGALHPEIEQQMTQIETELVVEEMFQDAEFNARLADRVNQGLADTARGKEKHGMDELFPNLGEEK